MSELGMIVIWASVFFTAPVVAFLIVKFGTMGYYAGRRSFRRRNFKQRKHSNGHE